jgi:cysteinyl-tRNA synthetase
MSKRRQQIKELKRRIKMLEEAEFRHAMASQEYVRRLDLNDRILDQHRMAVQPLLDERQAKTVTITISREDAEHYAKPAVVLEQLQPYLFRLHDACRAALEGER